MNPPCGRPVSAAVLAGGMSRRMGSDKALLPATPGGQTLLERALATVSDVADETFIVASGRPEYERFGVPVVADLHPGAGALGGIATALRAARCERCLVVACDMPFLNPVLLNAMIGWPGDWDVLAPSIAGESRQGPGQVIQTLHAI
ncbi:MAG: molybdenum cofactor guanylyltransferase [Chloroflexota bacterium]